MLYRHVQPLFLSSDYSERPVTGPRMQVRPLDTDAPDHLMRFLFWAAVQSRDVPTRVAAATSPRDPRAPTDPPDPNVVVVTAPVRPKLLIETSADAEGWVVASTLDARDKPYLVTVPHMLPFVRVRLDTSNGVLARGYALVMANAPFALDGRNPIMDPNAPIVVTGTRR